MKGFLYTVLFVILCLFIVGSIIAYKIPPKGIISAIIFVSAFWGAIDTFSGKTVSGIVCYIIAGVFSMIFATMEMGTEFWKGIWEMLFESYL